MADTAEKDEAQLGNETDEGAAESESELEARARRMGWKPQAEYRGDPDKWVTAQEFIEKGENELPVLRERLRVTDRRLEQTERALHGVNERLREQTEVLTQFRDFARDGEERARKRALEELEERHARQVSEADVAGAKATLAAIKEVEAAPAAQPKKAPETPQTPPAPQAPQVPPEVTAWVNSNKDWYASDPVMRGAAIALHGQLLQDRPDLSMEENLAEVKRQIVRRFPERFANSRRETPGSVNGPSEPGGRKPAGRTYADLPPEAKRACDRFVKEIPGYKREEYVATYFSGEA